MPPDRLILKSVGDPLIVAQGPGLVVGPHRTEAIDSQRQGFIEGVEVNPTALVDLKPGDSRESECLRLFQGIDDGMVLSFGKRAIIIKTVLIKKALKRFY